MEQIQILIPIEPKEFWRQLKLIVDDSIEQKLEAIKTLSIKDKPLINSKDLCEIFQISKPTIYEWLKKGKIQSIKIQSRRYFRRVDVEALIEKSKK